MRAHSVAMAVLAAALCGGLLGRWTVVAGHGETQRLQAGAPAPPRGDAAGVPQPAWALRDAAISPVVGDDLGRESTRALKDPAYLRRLMDRFAGETDLDRRGALLAVLQSAANDDVLRFALQLADSTSPAARQDGLQLLQAFPLDRAPVRDLLVRQLRDERDPALLKQLVDMLTPTVLPTEDAAPVAAQLARLREHPDPDVRAASVLQTAQWDRGADLESLLHQAMLDPAAQVRQAAVAGVTASHLHSDRLKDSLLAIASDPSAASDERSAAVFALQEFPLDRGEYELYRQAAGETGPGAGDDDGEHTH